MAAARPRPIVVLAVVVALLVVVVIGARVLGSRAGTDELAAERERAAGFVNRLTVVNMLDVRVRLAVRDVDAAQGLQIAEELRRRINALRFSLPDGSDFNVSASIGIGAFDPKKHRDGDALYREVDAALYKAKAGGRNRVVAIQ